MDLMTRILRLKCRRQTRRRRKERGYEKSKCLFYFEYGFQSPPRVCIVSFFEHSSLLKLSKTFQTIIGVQTDFMAVCEMFLGWGLRVVCLITGGTKNGHF